MEIEEILYSDPLNFYEYFLLGPFSNIYSAKKKTNLTDWLNYSNLLIEKFAIHSSSFFHLSQGIIEHKSSTEKVKVTGYDLFTVNSVFRVMIETYITYNHIFVEPKTTEEKQFRFYLWKIDGFFEQNKAIIDLKNEDLKRQKEFNDKKLEKVLDEIKQNSFYQSLQPSELIKIFNPEKKKSLWKFTISESHRIRPLKIIELIEHVCRISGFLNAYKYSSIHSHSNFISLEHFEQTRGKKISNEATDPLTRIAIYLTALLLEDICKTDENAKFEFSLLPNKLIDFINGINKSIRETNLESNQQDLTP
jgi:hypothetical protein